jgi:hypothetical protein
MWLHELSRRWFGPSRSLKRVERRLTRQRPRVHLRLETLEDRVVPAVFNVGPNDVATLLHDMITANSNGESNTINLSPSTYDLIAVNNNWYGPNALPAISSKLTINGNGAVLQRDSSLAPNMRLFYVSGGLSGLAAGSLTLNDLTLEGGVAQGGNGDTGGGGLGAGGAIFNQGNVVLNGVTVSGNSALGGGGIVTNGDGGGGGMGQDGQPGGDGGGFGGNFPGHTYGGTGGEGGGPLAGGGGGGGFSLVGADGQPGALTKGGDGGGQSGLGGGGVQGSYDGNGGDGGGGGAVKGAHDGGDGGDFGFGGQASYGGGGVGGGGGYAGNGGFGGGGGYDGNGGFGGGGGWGAFGGFGGGGSSRSPSSSRSGGGAGMGGGLFNMYGSLTLVNCTLTGNTAQGGYGYGSGSGYGGAVFNLDGTVNLTFCTLSGNTVAAGQAYDSNHTGTANGGDVYNLAYGNVYNTGGAISSTATIANSILANSTGGNDLVNNVVNGANTNTATVTLSGPNLVRSSTGTISGTTPLTSDPQLGSLQNNGGPTPTLAIPNSSPATGAATSVSGVTTDQREYTRPTTTPSLGAYDPLAVPPLPPAPPAPPSPPPPPTPPSPPAPPLTASIQFTSVTVVPNLFALKQTETIDVHISGSGVVVDQGMVTFTVDGQTVSASVDGSGDAVASLTLPMQTAASPQSISAVFSSADRTPANATQTAMWMSWNALLPSVDTFAADGGQSVQSYIFGVPFLDFSYNSSGQLTEIVLGANSLRWDFLYFGGITVVRLNGELPVMVF